jgi:ribosome modulation factor
MHTLAMIREAQVAGTKAYKDGVSQYDCPYSYMTENVQAIAWERAWRDAQTETAR